MHHVKIVTTKPFHQKSDGNQKIYIKETKYSKIGGNKNSPNSFNVMVNCHYHSENRSITRLFSCMDDRMMGKEAQGVLANLSQIVSAKMEEPISHVDGWVNGWVAITVIRLYSRMLCGDRFPSPLPTRDPGWQSGQGSGLAQ